MNAYLSRKNFDHNTPQRKQAIRALAGKIDRMDAKPVSWLTIALVVAMFLAFAYGMGAHLAIAAVLS